ncbi:MAG: H-type small acid-soluble spore protein [Bacillota bacterium]|nr:H-type small acid-soluble spore protein [Bacillota bacterium]MDW7684640.1 H-type small acid-soluble spore protein [Bacillota bacterium]
MDKDRAEQILQSPDPIDVVYRGKPVWIEGVGEDTANVTVMGTCRTMDVPFEDLRENNFLGPH